MTQCEPARAVDRPAGVEHHRGDQCQLEPTVQHELGHPRGAEQVHRHDGEHDRGGQDRADRHAARQVVDLGPAFCDFLVLGVGGTRRWSRHEAVAGIGDGCLQLARRDSGRVVLDGRSLGAEAHVDPVDAGQLAENRLDVHDARGARHARDPELRLLGRERAVGGGSDADRTSNVVRSVIGGGGPVGRLHDQGAVDHVHATCEVEPAGSVRCQLERRRAERRQRLGRREVREHHT
jgi:hypothetical protein